MLSWSRGGCVSVSSSPIKHIHVRLMHALEKGVTHSLKCMKQRFRVIRPQLKPSSYDSSCDCCPGGCQPLQSNKLQLLDTRSISNSHLPVRPQLPSAEWSRGHA